MAVMQLLRIGIEQGVFCFVERTNFISSVATAAAMILLTIVILVFRKLSGKTLSIMPETFNKGYIIATILFIVMLVLTAVLFSYNLRDWFMLIYASVITPIFEEILFRGYIWNRLKESFSKEVLVYILNAVLFAVWHLGYWEGIAFRCGNTEILHIMLWKVIIGLGFGIIVGALRCKTHNCYSTIMLHGIMNMFGK